MENQFNYALGVDLSATNTNVILANSKGECFSKRKSGTDVSSPDAPAKNVIYLAYQCLEDADISPGNVYGVGISCLGPYDNSQGGIKDSPNLPFDFVPVEDPIREAFPESRFIRGGDCIGAVHAEYYFGLGKGKKDFAYITISTGIGGGVVVDGNVLQGKDGDAGHVGHLPVNKDPDARECGCKDSQGNPRRGHWEAYSSGTALAKQAQELFQLFRNGEHYKSPFLKEETEIKENDLELILSSTEKRLGKKPEIKNIKAEDLYQAVKYDAAGASQQLVMDANEFNTIGAATTNSFYDTELIIFGGSMMNDSDLILPYIRRNIERHTILTPPEIEKTNLGSDNVALGGIAMLRHYG